MIAGRTDVMLLDNMRSVRKDMRVCLNMEVCMHTYGYSVSSL